MAVSALAFGAAIQCASAAAVTSGPVVVQAHVVAERCLTRDSAGRARVDVASSIRPAEADVVVAPDEILGRFLESGELVEGTAVELGDVPWVLAADSAPPAWADLERLQPEIWVLGGSAGGAARKMLQRIDPARVHSTTDLAKLGAAPLALVPAPIARGRMKAAAPFPPLRLRGALTRRGASSQLARDVLRSIANNDRLRQCVTGD
jgi:hypothetical protein